jgi:hypothetical protein
LEDWAEILRLHRPEQMPVRAIARKLGLADRFPVVSFMDNVSMNNEFAEHLWVRADPLAVVPVHRERKASLSKGTRTHGLLAAETAAAARTGRTASTSACPEPAMPGRLREAMIAALVARTAPDAGLPSSPFPISERTGASSSTR